MIRLNRPFRTAKMFTDEDEKRRRLHQQNAHSQQQNAQHQANRQANEARQVANEETACDEMGCSGVMRQACARCRKRVRKHSI